MPKKQAKEMVLGILRSYQHLYVENHALKALLSTSFDPGIRDSWESALKQVIKSSGAYEISRPMFDELYAQVSEATDAEAALQLLAKLPLPSSKPN